MIVDFQTDKKRDLLIELLESQKLFFETEFSEVEIIDIGVKNIVVYHSIGMTTFLIPLDEVKNVIVK